MTSMLKINAGLVGREFSGSEKAFIATTLRRATDVAMRFGKFKDDGSVKLAADIADAARGAIEKAGKNGDAPAILVVDRTINKLGSDGNMSKEVESLDLEKALLLVLDAPDAQERIREAIRQGELDLTPLVSVHVVNGIGKGVDNKAPFVSQFAYHSLPKDESY